VKNEMGMGLKRMGEKKCQEEKGGGEGRSLG
jgi:hypothetical protein